MEFTTVILLYTITVQGLEVGAMHDRDDQVQDPGATFAVLSGLLPDTKYRVHIYAMTFQGRGEGTFIEVETTRKTGTVIALYSLVKMCTLIGWHF